MLVRIKLVKCSAIYKIDVQFSDLNLSLYKLLCLLDALHTMTHKHMDTIIYTHEQTPILLPSVTSDVGIPLHLHVHTDTINTGNNNVIIDLTVTFMSKH